MFVLMLTSYVFWYVRLINFIHPPHTSYSLLCFPWWRVLLFCHFVLALPPPALLASLKYKYACSPCVLSSLLRSWCWLILFFFSYFPLFDFSDFDLDMVCFILSCSCGYYAVSSVSVSATTRLAYDMYVDTYVRWSHRFTFVWGIRVCFRYGV